MKIQKSEKPIRIKTIQVNTKSGFIKYPIYKNSTYGKLEQKLKFYAAKHGVLLNMVGAEIIDKTMKFKKPAPKSTTKNDLPKLF
jgi:hypothetical protein